MHQLIAPGNAGQAMRMFEGTTVLPLDAESANYREWLVTIGGTQYCIIHDQDEWVLMRYDSDPEQWIETTVDVDTFLASYRLILAA